MQLELFGDEHREPAMRMIMDTRDVSILGRSPEEAIEALAEARGQLPRGAEDVYIEIFGQKSDLHQVCRLKFRRPQTEEERALELRYSHPRLRSVA